jgi:hypothetical protein
MSILRERSNVSLLRTLLVALLVAVAGCSGAGVPGAGGDESTTAGTTVGTTTADTTEPHTAQGTSHAGDHLSVRAVHGAGNVTVTLAPDGDAASFQIDEGAERSFTREIHDRGHDVRVVVARDGEVVFDQSVRGYQYYQLTVYGNETSVTQTVV